MIKENYKLKQDNDQLKTNNKDLTAVDGNIYRVFYTRWNDETNCFISESIAVYVSQTSSFEDMSMDITRQFNDMCSNNSWDISWITGVESY